jgi:hypothetical protein
MSRQSMPEESPEVQAAMLLAAALLLASVAYMTEDACNAVRCLRSVLRCDPLTVTEDRPF